MSERRSDPPASDRVDATTGTDLRPRALRLPGVLMQALTHIAPAVGMVAFIPMITGFSGITSPLAYLIAFLIVAMLGVSLMQLAKHLPSAGGYYTYVSRTVSPRVGFLAAWTLFIIVLLAPGAGLGFGGFLFEGAMKAEYGITFPWWVFLLLGTALIFVVSYFGIRIAVGLSVVLSAIEILIVLVLSLSSLASPGPGGINASPFDPSKSVSTNGLFLAVVFTIFAFAGFESVAPLAEESVNPRRTIPWAIWISIAISGVFYVFTGWALLTGWGTNNVKGFIAPGENPIFALAHRLWGGAWILVLLAVVKLHPGHRHRGDQRRHQSAVRDGPIGIAAAVAGHRSPEVPNSGQHDLHPDRDHLGRRARPRPGFRSGQPVLHHRPGRHAEPDGALHRRERGRVPVLLAGSTG